MRRFNHKEVTHIAYLTIFKKGKGIVFSKRDLQKAAVSLSVGVIYWGLVKIVDKLMNFSAVVKGTIDYIVLPGIISMALLLLLKERSYRSLIYSGILVLVFFFLDLVENLILIASVYNPFKATYLVFIRVGVVSMISAILAGVLSITINRSLTKEETNKVNS